jgi:hypothetical protein
MKPSLIELENVHTALLEASRELLSFDDETSRKFQGEVLPIVESVQTISTRIRALLYVADTGGMNETWDHLSRILSVSVEVAKDLEKDDEFRTLIYRSGLAVLATAKAVRGTLEMRRNAVR